ncbi:MAG: hypothetical protein L0H23_06095, partial [Luteimonas sp.]|nr:hypothetical protein [Luteimonas sp.]
PPGDQVTLGTNQKYSLRLGYRTDVPVRIWAQPYFRGKVVDAGSSPSPRYEGSGEALGWFFFMEPGTQVDEIRITAGNGRSDGTPLVASYRVRVIAGSAPVTATEPAWVARLKQQADASMQRDRQAAASQPDSGGDSILFGGIMLALPLVGLLGLALPAWALWRWRGGWRLAAAVPAALVAFVVLRIVLGVVFDPSSHNMWPFEMLMAGGVASVLVLALWLARKLSGAGGAR